MSIVRLIIVNIFIVNIRLWLSKSLFATDQAAANRLQRKPFTLWILWWGLLFLYPKIINSLDLSSLLYTATETITPLHAIGITLLILLFLIVFYFLFKKRSQSLQSLTKLLIPLLIIAVLIALITTVHPLLWSAWYILYFILIAFSEESIKFFGSSPARLYSLLPTDIILLTIIAALWFWFIENIIYAIAALWDWQSLIQNLKPALNSTITRWAIWFMMHALFTGTAAAIIAKHISPSPKTVITWTTVWVLASIIFHTMYNTIVHNNITWLLILLVAWWYLLLTYLMVSSDSVYLDELEG